MKIHQDMVIQNHTLPVFDDGNPLEIEWQQPTHWWSGKLSMA